MVMNSGGRDIAMMCYARLSARGAVGPRRKWQSMHTVLYHSGLISRGRAVRCGSHATPTIVAPAFLSCQAS